MLRNWRTFVLPTFVTVALTSGPALAGEGAGGKAKLKPLQERLEDINKALEKSFEDVAREIAALKKDVKEVRENQTKLVEPLQRQMAELRTDLELLRKRLPADVALYPPFSADHATLESIRNRIGELESRLSRLQTEPRLALSAPATGRTGRILLVNNYGSDTLFIVRGQSHRVPAGATVEVRNVPAGTFDYEAITPNWDPVRRTTTLAADETLSLVVR